MLTEPIRIGLGEEGRVIVPVPYSPARVAKIKTVPGRRWHRGEQYWTIPHTDLTLSHRQPFNLYACPQSGWQRGTEPSRYAGSRVEPFAAMTELCRPV